MRTRRTSVNSLPYNKVLDSTKLKTFVVNKIKVAKEMFGVLDQNFFLFPQCFRNLFQGRVVNIVGKGENTGHQHFLLFQPCLQKASSSRSLKSVVFGKD